jgi:hypothetical protein
VLMARDVMAARKQHGVSGPCKRSNRGWVVDERKRS